MTSGAPQQLMFVSDEASAIQWLRQLIKEKPQTFDIVHSSCSNSAAGARTRPSRPARTAKPELLCYDGKGLVPEQIHAYLSTNWKELRNLPKDDPTLVAKARDRWYLPDPNKAGDLEKSVQKALLWRGRGARRLRRNSGSFAWRLSAPDSRKPGRSATTPSSSP